MSEAGTEIGSFSGVVKDGLLAETADQRELREFWEDFSVYHGTSRKDALKIKEEGFSVDKKSYSWEDRDFVRGQLEKRGVEVDAYRNNSKSSFFVDASIVNTTRYALMGPENTRISLYPKVHNLVETMELEKSKGVQVDESDYQRALDIKKKMLEDIYIHRPALLKLRKNTEAFKQLVRDNFNDQFYKLMFDYETFKDFRDLFLTEYGESGKSRVKAFFRQMFFNKMITSDLKANDFEVIDGEEFDNFSELAKDYAEIRDLIFGDEQRQPPELVNCLTDIVHYDFGDLNGVLGLCNFYEISPEVGKQLYIRAVELKKSR